VTSDTVIPEQSVDRRQVAVDAPVHDENPQDIDEAIDLYGDSSVREAPAELPAAPTAGRTGFADDHLGNPSTARGDPAAPASRTPTPRRTP
jgi:hypothetical protein